MNEIKKLYNIARTAQEKYSTFTQCQVDKIFYQASKIANVNRIDLAKQAVIETGRGIWEDKVLKNHFASEFIYNKYKNMQTVGVIKEDDAAGYKEIVEPIGVITAIIPVTNPTSTAIFKILMAIKTRNAIVISPHPQAKSCTYNTAKLMAETAVKFGAPEGLIQCIEEPSMDGTMTAMKEGDRILATGGGGLVTAAYSSGTPAIGVGAGNAPAIIHETADLDQAVSSIIQSNMFDNGMVCATENSVVVVDSVYDKVAKLFVKRNALIISDKARIAKVEKGMFKEGHFGLLHPGPIGKSPVDVAKHFGFTVPVGTKLMLIEATGTKKTDALAHEKLSTYVSLYRATDYNDAMAKAKELLTMGAGHTASLHIDERMKDEIELFQTLNAGRLLINTPSALGGIGDFYNFALAPSMTLGCGSWGNNSFAGQVGPSLLLNIKRIAMRRENTLWLKVPKTYFKEGCTPEALKDLTDEGVKTILVVSDKVIWGLYGKKMTQYLEAAGITVSVFTDVPPNPTLSSVRQGVKVLESLQPDCIMGFGGGSAIDAGKLMWFMYEVPGADFNDLALTFADIRKRIVKFPALGKKSQFVAVPTTAGTGSEVTPFSVITDEVTHKKYPLADYSLTPNMAIVDAQFQMTIPRYVTAVSGMDALTHAIEAYVSILANEFTDPYSLKAIKMIFEFLPRAIKDGANDKAARIGMAHAATIAGIAFSNAFLGIVHSLSHKIGGYHGVVHGQANAILLPYVIKYNSRVNHGKQALFAQHKYPVAEARYADIARHIGLTGKSDADLVNKLADKITNLTSSIGLETNFSSEKLISNAISKAAFNKDLDAMAVDAFDDQCTGANPRYPLIKDIKEIYKWAYEGKDPKKLLI